MASLDQVIAKIYGSTLSRSDSQNYIHHNFVLYTSTQHSQ
jgi:hypothetical protein